MSTAFGILQIKVEHEKLVNQDGDLLDYISREIFEPVFFRGTNSRWLKNWAEFLDDDTKVYALDNTQRFSALHKTAVISWLRIINEKLKLK